MDSTVTMAGYITVNPVPGVSLSITDVNCNGGSDGTATAIPSGGTPGYSWLWDDPGNQITSTAAGLIAGIYSVTITDTNGCTVTGFDTINEPALLIGFLDITNETALNANDGSAWVIAIGGTPPHSYLWMPGLLTSDSITGLAAGTYTVTITDANGCTFVDSATVNSGTVGISGFDIDRTIKLYPNPTTGKFILQFGPTYPKNLVITVLNLIGEVITKIENENPTYNKMRHASSLQIDLSSEVNGLYFIKIQTHNRIITRKIILNR